MLRILLSFAILQCCFGAEPYFEIDVVDAATGRGVPLAEVEMVNHARFISDSAGRIAFSEPGAWGQSTFVTVRSDGYEFPKDGFGYPGTRVTPKPGGKVTLRLKRLNIAERLYRITGEGVYRDSVLLGETPPTREPVLNAQVLGQDSIQQAIYHGQIYWFWGDTLRLSYPLGNFRMSGATSALPSRGGIDPSLGVDLQYFTNTEGFCKGMFPIKPAGNLIWADGFMVLTNGGREQMIAHYVRLKGLGKLLGRGLAIYNDKTEEFDALAELKLEEPWRFPRGHPLRATDKGQNYFYFGDAFPNVRVAAETNAILNTNAYEAFSCLEQGSNAKDPSKVNRDENGRVLYRWTHDAPPVTPKMEADLIKRGLLKPEEARFTPLDAENGTPVVIHGGTVCWNEWRKRWILIGVQEFGVSYLGEIWYSEADSPVGPWRKARKVATHPHYSFYNPAQHPFFDQDGGRIIYFEGTYTAEFSGNKNPTPRYDYNQIMYRLDLADARLKDVQ
jgi:hypothetical protein